ncbi:MAG TPA: hypothetical protein VK453_10560 [Micromonosporaceae bacterium]|nr:hypothetical protein [Micromonosporaceae bacterium]
MRLTAQKATRSLRFGLRAILVSAVMASGLVAVAGPAHAGGYANLMVTPDSYNKYVQSYQFTKTDARGYRTTSRCIRAVYGRWESTNIMFMGDGRDTLTVRRFSDTWCGSYRGATTGIKFWSTSGSNWWYRVRMY